MMSHSDFLTKELSSDEEAAVDRIVSSIEAFGHLPDDDCRILEDPSIAAMFKEDIREAIRQGGDGIVAELRALMNPWEFPIEKLAVPVRIWHGTEDTVVPVAAGRYLAQTIPLAEFHLVEGGGHFIALKIIKKVLRSDRFL